jgi:enoyl-[acyl-carrier protein] reductase II
LKKVVSAPSEDAIKADYINIVFPSAGKETYEEVSPHALRTPFIEQWNGRSRIEVEQKAYELRDMLVTGMNQGRDHEFVPFTGRSAGLFQEILPSAEIINLMVVKVRESLEHAGAFLI